VKRLDTILLRVSKVVKRDGRVVDFDVNRIRNAVRKAMVSVRKYDEKVLEEVVNYVIKAVNEKYGDGKTPHVEDIQDIVELALVKFDLYEVAKAYILYRKERERIRKEKMAILGKASIDEVDKAFSVNAIRVLASRYLLKDRSGRIIESPKQLFERVAALVVIPDILYSSTIFDKEGKQPVHPFELFNPSEWDGKVGLGKRIDGGFNVTWSQWHLERLKALYDELNAQGKMKLKWSDFWAKLVKGEFDSFYDAYTRYYRVMVEKKFIPNSPTLFNAGTRLGQLSACFVLDIDDSMDSIMKAASDAALIFKSGGGIGMNYSKLRAEGDVVSTTQGTASGPLSFMRIIDVVTDVVKQGGKRRGACMGILEVWHPDIEKFITAKSVEGFLTNFNLSVLITPDFWEYYENDKPYPLRNPRDGRIWREVSPRRLLRLIAEMAWASGDPGVLFLDNINRVNVLRKALGDIRSTNPCGEEPLYPYESCNLGSINLYAFVAFEGDRPYFDWNSFDEVVMLAQRFLDNVIDVNNFPLKTIEERTKNSRKIGLGLMGLADTLFALRIPYNDEEGFSFMRRVSEHLTYYAMRSSALMAAERGPFPLFPSSSYVNGDLPVEGYYHKDWWTLNWNELVELIKRWGIRNAEVTTIAPTGTISMIADTSSGIEPQFALVYEKRVTIGQFLYVDVEFERQLKGLGLYDETLLKKVADNGGSVQGLNEIPEELRRFFVVAYDIPWYDHVRAQSEIAKWICAAVSKTINMPSWVTVEDVEKAFLFAYKLNLKGLTIYRDGSKGVQVLVTPSQRRGSYVATAKNETLNLMVKLGIEPPKPVLKPEVKEAVYLKAEPLKPPPTITLKEVARQPEVCPECGSKRLVYEEKCVKCLDCGWVACVAA